MKMRVDEPLPEAGRRMLRDQFQLMLSHEDGTRRGDDTAATHDMRVATRRQRAIFRIVRPYFKRKAIRSHRDGLRALAKRLGAVRDLDVLIAAADADQSSPSERPTALAPLLDEWRTQRESARADLIAFLDGDVYRAFVDDYQAFLSSPGVGMKKSASKDSAKPHLVRDVAPGEIWSHYGRVRAYEPTLRRASMETLHALRIEGKRLRYLLEFFGEVLGPDVGKAIEQLVALQDCLGAMHDSYVGIGLVEEFLARDHDRAPNGDAAQAIQQYVRSKRAGLRAQRSELKVPWKHVIRKRYRKLLARMVANL